MEAANKTEHPYIANPDYNPDRLLDTLQEHLNIKNDAALARKLGVMAPVISKLRHRTLPVGDSMLVRMHDATFWPVNKLRQLMGIPEVDCQS